MLYPSRVVLKCFISQMNDALMKCLHPLMNYPQLLVLGIIFAVKRKERCIENENKIRTFTLTLKTFKK